MLSLHRWLRWHKPSDLLYTQGEEVFQLFVSEPANRKSSPLLDTQTHQVESRITVFISLSLSPHGENAKASILEQSAKECRASAPLTSLRETVRRGCVWCEVGPFKRSFSDLLKDSLIKMNQLIPFFNYTTQKMTDKSVCGNRQSHSFNVSDIIIIIIIIIIVLVGSL